MFTFVSKVFGKILWEDVKEGQAGNPVQKSQNADVQSTPNESQPLGEKWEKRITGKVTSLHQGYGLIDEEIYFSFNLFGNNDIPKIGTTVDVQAKKKHEEAGWKAILVTPHKNEAETSWDDSPDHVVKNGDGICANLSNATKENLISQVIKLQNNVGSLSNNLTFDLDSVSAGYYPAKGDWVTVDATLNPESGSRLVELVKPLREKAFEGEISSLHAGFGYINDDIYFTTNTCGKYVPKRNDLVIGHCIESTRGRSNWRALEVSPKAPNLEMCPTLSRRSPAQTKSLSELLRDKEGIRITETVQFSDMKLNDIAATKVFIRNGGDKVHILRSSRICDSGHGQFSIEDINYVPPDREKRPENSEFIAHPGKALVVTIVCRASNLGQEKQLLVFDFGDFKIGRHLKVTVCDSTFKSILEPTSPYQRTNTLKQCRLNFEERNRGDGWVVSGRRPARKWNIQLPNRLPEYPIPVGLEEAYLERGDLEVQAPTLGEALDLNNYSSRFSALLHMEEIQQNINIMEFDRERTCMRKIGEFLAIGVPGLSEGRPSVLVGDRVLATSPNEYASEPTHEGFVHEVLNEEILVKFHPEFHQTYGGEDYNIRFVLNRTQLRRCHQAVHFVPSLGPEVLFPSNLIPRIPQTSFGRGKYIVGKHTSPTKSDGERHPFINKKLNARQKSAVLRILSGQSRPTPYIIFGPPGTGKTITLVEALLQVHISVSSSRIIACAPSNSAADLITTRLHLSGMVKPNDLVRLNSYSRAEQEVPPLIAAYCKTGDDLELVSRHRILVSTCSSAGMMFALGLKLGHFTHVFIDEAGQATEPECMTPIGLVAGADGQVVLAGDPLQLGPVLQSKVAEKHGLGLSYLERLIQFPLYGRDEKKFADHGSYDPLLVTKLVQNYRSHAALVKLPSMLFYHNELQVSADPKLTNQLTAWDKLPNPEFPLIFHGIRGQDMREGSSPSWFNPMEVLQVMRYLQCLMSNSSTKLSMEDIGIIAPYRKQVEKIRLLIDKLGMDAVKVGSVEEFQGQERLVMILTTVRSNERYINSDVVHNLGFLSNPKRFNVSISRAQSLMIIVGNPHVLSQDKNWRVLLQYCLHHGAFLGCDYPTFDPQQGLDFTLPSSQATPATAEEKKTQEQDDAVRKTPHNSNIADRCSERMTTKLHSAPSQEGVVGSSESDGDDETLSAHSMDADSIDLPLHHNATELKRRPEADKGTNRFTYSTHTVKANSSHESREEAIATKSLARTIEDYRMSGQKASNTLNKGPSPDLSQAGSASAVDIKLSPSGRETSTSPGPSTTTRKSPGKRDSIADRLVKSLIEHRMQETRPDSRDSRSEDTDLCPCTPVSTMGARGEPSLTPPVDVFCDNEFLKQGIDGTTLSNAFNEQKTPSMPEGSVTLSESSLESCETDINRNPSPGPVVTDGDNKVGHNTSAAWKVVSEPASEVNNSALCADNSSIGGTELAQNGNLPDVKNPNPDPHHCPDNENTVKPSTDTHHPSTLETKIIKQVEYYFSDVNLYRDIFMKRQIEEDCGWVPLEILKTFNRLKALATDNRVITTALLKSNSVLLEVDVEGNRVRRSLQRPVPSDYSLWLSGLKNRGLFVIGLKTEVDKYEIECFFRQWGEVDHIHHLQPSRKPKGGSIVVTYPFVVLYYNPVDARRVLLRSRGYRFKQSMLFAHAREDIADMLFRKPQKYPARSRNSTQSRKDGNNTDTSRSTPLRVPSSNVAGAASRNDGLLPVPAPNLPRTCERPRQNDGLLLPDPIPACPTVSNDRNRHRAEADGNENFPLHQTSPCVLGLSIGRGRGRGRGRILQSIVAMSPSDSDRKPGSLNTRKSEGAKSVEDDAVKLHVGSFSLPADSSLHDNCLEQNDSDVVIESSDEEFTG